MKLHKKTILKVMIRSCGDRVSYCGGINPYTLTARHGQAQTRRSGLLHDDARSRSSRWSLAQGIKPDLENQARSWSVRLGILIRLHMTIVTG
jgi:predicted transcriptional regulator of viral defense system